MVRVAANQSSKGRPEGIIVEALQRNTQEVVGQLHYENGAYFVVPSSKNTFTRADDV